MNKISIEPLMLGSTYLAYRHRLKCRSTVYNFGPISLNFVVFFNASFSFV